MSIQIYLHYFEMQKLIFTYLAIILETIDSKCIQRPKTTDVQITKSLGQCRSDRFRSGVFRQGRTKTNYPNLH